MEIAELNIKTIQGIETTRSLIEDIKKDGTKIMFLEKDGSSFDATHMVLPMLEYVLMGLKATLTGTIDEKNKEITDNWKNK